MLRSTAEISSFGDEQAANRAAGGTVLLSDGPSSQDGAVEEEEHFKTATSMDTKLQQKTGELTKLMQQRAASKKGALRPSRRRRLGSWGMRALALVTVLGGLVPVGGQSTVHPKFDWGESVSRPLDINVSKQVNGTTMTIATYHPSALLSFARFDHYVKWAYASHLVQSGHLLLYSYDENAHARAVGGGGDGGGGDGGGGGGDGGGGGGEGGRGSGKRSPRLSVAEQNQLRASMSAGNGDSGEFCTPLG